MPRVLLPLLASIAMVFAARAQTTQTSPPRPAPPQASPATTRSASRSAEEMLKQMLQPATRSVEPISPLPDQAVGVDATSGDAAVAPHAATQPLAREGTLLLDRTGRLTAVAGGAFELTLDSDGAALADPPMRLIPNRKLMQLEDRLRTSYRDLKLRVSGEVTEYRGRNYLLLQRWSVVPDSVQPLQ